MIARREVARRGVPHAFDMATEWRRWQGLPFVFAVWAVRGGVDLGPAEHAFAKAKRAGLARAGEIAAREAGPLGLDPGYVRRYFTNILHYDLGPAELAGLDRFHGLAAALGLAPAGVPLVRYHRPHLVPSR